MVEELAGLGYVERGEDPDDGRRRPVRLTPRGEDALRRSEAIFDELRDELAGELGSARLAEGLQLLGAIQGRWGPRCRCAPSGDRGRAALYSFSTVHAAKGLTGAAWFFGFQEELFGGVAGEPVCGGGRSRMKRRSGHALARALRLLLSVSPPAPRRPESGRTGSGNGDLA